MPYHCGILVPFLDSLSTGSDRTPRECLMPERHQGRHLFLRNDGVFVEWYMDDECGHPESEECECYISSELDPLEALKRLQTLPYLVQPLLQATELEEPYELRDVAQLEFEFTAAA